MEFNLIDSETWKRKDYYLYYMHNVRCTYSITVNIDIAELKKETKNKGIKIYPALIYMLTDRVNDYNEFRTDKDSQDRLGYWSKLAPSYSVFNRESETFASIWTLCGKSFGEFHENYLKDISAYSNAETLMPKPNAPANLFNISSLPWTSFSGFNINVHNDGTYLLPIFTMGKFIEKDDQVLLPLAVQVHHAVCDGFHVSKFINSFQYMAHNYNEWIDI